MAKVDYIEGYINGVVDTVTCGSGIDSEHGFIYRITEDFITLKRIWYLIPVMNNWDEPPQPDEPVYTEDVFKIDKKGKWKSEVLDFIEKLNEMSHPVPEPPFED